MLRLFLSVSAVYAVGVPLSLLVNILLARWMPVEEFGKFSFTIAFATILSLPVGGGLALLLTREVAKTRQSGEWQRYGRLVTTASLWIVAASCALAACVLGIARLTAGESDLATGLALALVPGLAFVSFGEGIAKGFGRPSFGEALRQLIPPTLLLLGAASLRFAGRLDSDSALIAQFAGLCAATIVALSYAFRQPPRDKLRLALVSLDEFRSLSAAFLSFAMITGLGLLISQFATLTLGFLGNEAEVAYLKVAERGSQLVALPLTFVNAILGPKIVQAHMEGNRSELVRLSRSAARLALAAALPIAAILLIWGRPIIGLTFGPEFVDASFLPMAVLCLAQLFFVALGAPALFLAMTGHERENLISRALGFVVLAACVLVFAADYGALGAAIGVAIGLVVIKLFAAAILFRRLRFFSGPV